MANEQLTINIRPPVSIYETYKRLSYQPWYAIAEFVDNSTQNYHDHNHILKEVYKKEGGGRLCIRVQYSMDDNSLTIHDNANGMNFDELRRAVMLNRPPPDRSGRSEFGMGLKTAACWFGPHWRIETTKLGSEQKLTVDVNVKEISQRSNEVLNVQLENAKKEDHYTKITIFDIYQPIKGRTAGRIKDQLSSMYRQDLRTNEIEIWYNGTPLKFEEPPILIEKLDSGTERIWKKNLVFEVPWEAEQTNLSVSGWVGIRLPGSQRDAGFVLLRRGRVIIGGPDRGYKPVEIFGQGNTFSSQRLIGELHLDQWPVTQAKDDFNWSGGLEEKFIEELKKKCRDYSDKAELHRQTKLPPSDEEMRAASEPTISVFSNKEFSRAITSEIALPTKARDKKEEKEDISKIKTVSKGPQKFKLRVSGTEWEFNLHWQNKISDAPWMELSYPKDTLIDIFLNSAHPFFTEYLDKPGFLELLTKFVLALALAEKISRVTHHGELIDPADFRHNMNRVLKYASEIKNAN